MKTYTSDEVVELYKEYWSKHYAKVPEGTALNFADWLKQKEDNSPLKDGDYVWVRDNVKSSWFKRIFSHFTKDGVCITYKRYCDEGTISWTYYSRISPKENISSL